MSKSPTKVKIMALVDKNLGEIKARMTEANDRTSHPLYLVFMAAIDQCTQGKGQRHGGNVTPFLDQPWSHYHKMHGRGFLTGQAAKKLEEAASGREGIAFENEVLGAIVYAAMAIIMEPKEL